MSKVASNHGAISLWEITAKVKQLGKNFSNSSKKSLIVSLISAFFIVIVFALALKFTDQFLTNFTKPSLAQEEEKTAFVPGQFVSEIVYRGYLAR